MVSFHVGHSLTRFYKIVGRMRCHVLKHKPPSNHIMVVCYNVKGHGQGLLDFHAPTKEFLACKCWTPKVLKTSFRRRRLVGGPGFENMGVAS